MPNYKYFSDQEVQNLNATLCVMLDKARGIAGIPFVITSGFRTAEQNKAVGGVPNSAHLKGLAADILADTNLKRFAVLRGILATNTPCFIEIAQKHIHIDIDSEFHAFAQAMLSNDDYAPKKNKHHFVACDKMVCCGIINQLFFDCSFSFF